MHSLLQQLSYIVPALSIIFLIIITSINFYLKIRRKFPITVNCWFCNQNTKVPYAESNSWTCPSCEQYNGFTEDGDYNCDIPSQRSSKLNRGKGYSLNFKATSINGSIHSQSMYEPPSNGLCELCNRNQELKMQQLASFEPEDEAYFGEEVENYRKKLEHAYRLCPRCERHLKRALNRVKNNILGSKLAQIGAKGLSAFDLHMNRGVNKKIVRQKRQLFTKLCLFALITVSLLNLYKTSQAINITKAKLDQVFTPAITTTILVTLSYLSAFGILVVKFFDYLNSLPYLSQVTLSVKLLSSYLYFTLSGNVVELFQTSALQHFGKISALPVELDTQSGDNETVLLNLAGCFLSIFLIFMTGLKTGPIAALMLWSMEMALPAMFSHTHGLAMDLAMDASSLFIVWASTILSAWNWYSLTEKTVENEPNNSSFHRIYSESNSDVSDESDVEEDLNASIRSTGSNCSLRSRRTFRSNNTTLSNSVLSCSPSIHSPLPLRKQMSSSVFSLNQFGKQQEMNSFGQLNQVNQKADLRGSVFGSTQSVYSAMAGHLSPRPFESYENRNPNYTDTQSVFCKSPTSTLFSTQPQKPFEELDIRCSSRNSCRDIPDDFESGITQLSISGLTEKRFNASSHFNGLNIRRAASSGFTSSLRNRNQILLPSRLGYNDGPQMRPVPVNQTSWLAGGYWSSTSPKKKFNPLQPQQPIFMQSKEVFPIISRTSSQSSGFESQASSVRNGQENNSRENSLCDEVVDAERDSMFSEPSILAQSTKIGGGIGFQGSLMGLDRKQHDNNFNSFASQRFTGNSQPVFSRLDHAQDTLTATNLQKSLSLDSSKAQKASSPFHFKPIDTSSMSGRNFKLTSPSFHEFHKNLQPFRKGSLLKMPRANGEMN